MICAGLDMITPVPIERWDNELYYDPDTSAPGKMPLGSMMRPWDPWGSSELGVDFVYTVHTVNGHMGHMGPQLPRNRETAKHHVSF